MLKSMVSVFIFGLSVLPSVSSAQVYPNRPVKLVVPFGTGAPDTIARLVGQNLAMQLGQPFVVENRVGANGVIGTKVVSSAQPDGYTLLLTSSALAINPSIYKKLPFDTVKDLAPVTQIATTEALFLAVNPSVPANSVKELLALIQKPESKLAYGSPGVGNLLHLAGELFNTQAKQKAVHVPYSGAGPAITALLAGDVQFEFLTPPLSIPHIKSGKLKALGYTNNKRSALLPAIPTMKEEGVDGMEIDGGWFALFAPAGTPPPVVLKLQQAVKKSLSDPTITQRLSELALEPVGSTSTELQLLLDQQIKKFGSLAKLANIQPE